MDAPEPHEEAALPFLPRVVRARAWLGLDGVPAAAVVGPGPDRRGGRVKDRRRRRWIGKRGKLPKRVNLLFNPWPGLARFPSSTVPEFEYADA
eukprot:9487192-Pyramimonas_sp.AAC.1